MNILGISQAFWSLTSQTTVAVLAVTLLSSTSLATAGGKNPNLGVLPTNSNPFGRSYGEWGGAYWQWVLSIPGPINPLFDASGDYAANNQSGPVWFLAASYVYGPVTRQVTIPAGKGIFLAIDTGNWINVPEFGDNSWSDEQNAYVRSLIAEFIDLTHDLTCTIDGVPVKDLASYRTSTPAGSEYFVTVPDENITGVLPAGTYGPAVDDGYYLVLSPLSKGNHLIHVTGVVPTLEGGDGLMDVSYQITVK